MITIKTISNYLTNKYGKRNNIKIAFIILNNIHRPLTTKFTTTKFKPPTILKILIAGIYYNII